MQFVERASVISLQQTSGQRCHHPVSSNKKIDYLPVIQSEYSANVTASRLCSQTVPVGACNISSTEAEDGGEDDADGATLPARS